jgi:hypothetical protein
LMRRCCACGPARHRSEERVTAAAMPNSSRYVCFSVASIGFVPRYDPR